ncbi:hypothetical protein KC866_01845 [Patescibacteria group bacterium]|nr:hypothetical protein [Patescibacteria group bacterium]
MKKFLTQNINFTYAVIVMLALVIGIGTVSANESITSSGYGTPGQAVPPILHQGAGDQAIESLRLGECPPSAPENAPCHPIGALDTRGPTAVGPVTLFDTTVTNPFFGVLDDMVGLGRLYVSQNAGTFVASLVSGTNGVQQPIQKVNVDGDAKITSLSHVSSEENVCIATDGVLVLCPNLTSGSCGAAAGHTYSTPPTNNLCSAGTASSVTTNPSTYTWTCTGTGGTANCSANRVIPVDGVCGPAAGHTYNTPPTNGLCTAGNPGAVQTNPTTYSWTCYGTGGGNNSPTCSANRTLAVNGQCENFPGSYTTQPANSTNGCIAGTYNDLSDTGALWRWECNGTNGGTNASPCTANVAPVGNPSCKPWTGSYTYQPAYNNSTGCTVGTYADATDTSTLWKWTCTDNAVTINCSANKETYNGYLFVCGTDPDEPYHYGQSAPGNSRWSQWTRGGTYSPNGTGDEEPFNMGSYDCTDPVTIPFLYANPWELPNGQDPNNPTNDGYDGTMTNPISGQGDKLYWKYFCLDAAPSDCFCKTAGSSEPQC